MKAFVRRAADVTVLATATFLLITSVAYGSGENGRGCPDQVGEGVICTGPQVPLTWLPQIQMQARFCPVPVGEGVLCRGPEIPDDARFYEPAWEHVLFIPAVSR
jgi:hypothetical protein